MKTVAVGVLLLLALHCCTAIPYGMREIEPVQCCYKFYLNKIPQSHIKTITKTHDSCSMKAFVVSTLKGKICVKQNEEWAKKAFNKAQDV